MDETRIPIVPSTVQGRDEPGADNPRAEALVAAIYAQVQTLRLAGRVPGRILMSLGHYRIIQQWRANLGDLPDASLDYLGRYDLFGLEVFVDDQDGPLVE